MGMVSASAFGNARRPMGAPVKIGSGASGGTLNIGDIRLSASGSPGANFLAANTAGNYQPASKYPGLAAIFGTTPRIASYASQYAFPTYSSGGYFQGSGGVRAVYAQGGKVFSIGNTNLNANNNGIDSTKEGMISLDGKTFSAISINGGQAQTNGVLWDGTSFISYGYSYSSVSSNGQSWVSLGGIWGNWQICGMAFGNGVYVAIGFDGNASPILLTSTTGRSWTARTSPFGGGGNQANVQFFNGLFVAISGVETGGANCIATSPDGINWTKRYSYGVNAANVFNNLQIGAGGRLIGFATQSGYCLWSSDGVNWSQTPPVADTLFLTGTSYNNTYGVFGSTTLVNVFQLLSALGVSGWAPGYIDPTTGNVVILDYFSGNNGNNSYAQYGLASVDNGSILIPQVAVPAAQGLAYIRAA